MELGKGDKLPNLGAPGHHAGWPSQLQSNGGGGGADNTTTQLH